MSIFTIENPFEIFTDVDGSPLEDGNVYIGTKNLNPVTNPISVYWDSSFTIPALQPIKTINGFLSKNGSPGRLYSQLNNYSILVTNKNGALVYSDLAFTNLDSIVDQVPVHYAALALALAAITAADVGKIVTTTEYATGYGYEGGNSYIVEAHDAGNTYDLGSLLRGTVDTSVCVRGLFPNGHNAKQFGCVGVTGTDNQTAIESYLTYVRTKKGRAYFTNNATSSAVYDHSSTIYFGASDITIEGETTAVNLKYTGTGTGLQVNSASGTGTARERVGLKNISLLSSTGVKGFDFTCANYGVFNDFEINYTAANAELITATGNDGAGPYFNGFDGFSLFGSVGRTQIGITLESDASGNLADGPNANEFSNVKRGASLLRLLDLKAGTGNLFSNVSGESIEDAMIVLNDIPAATSGTATSSAGFTLTDSGALWSAVQGDATNWIGGAVKITDGTYSGIVRRITSNTTTVLTLDKPFPDALGTPTYEIYKPKAIKNMFVNVRQEGVSSSNPDGIRIMPGARGNEFSQLEIGSLGSGSILDDQYGDPSNQVKLGELVINTFVVENPGASASISVVPRSSSLGGIICGSTMVLEYVELISPNFVAGSATATLTVDQGGTATGNGTNSLVAIIGDTLTTNAFAANLNKVQLSSANYPIFINLTTNANVNAASDFIITVAYRVS